MAREETNMNFHISDGEDYYSQDENSSQVKLSLILEAINYFDWSNLNIEDKEVRKRLAKQILRNIS